MKNKNSPVLKSIKTRILEDDALAIYLHWSNDRHFVVEITPPYTKKNVINAFINLIRMLFNDKKRSNKQTNN